MSRSSRHGPTSESDTISFRLDDDSLRELLLRAERRDVSQHQLAREYVFEMLGEAEERVALRRAVSTTAHAVIELRKDLALAVEAILIATGTYTEEEAHSWVTAQFRID